MHILKNRRSAPQNFLIAARSESCKEDRRRHENENAWSKVGPKSYTLHSTAVADLSRGTHKEWRDAIAGE